MPSPLRNMPSLAAAASECRLWGTGSTRREINPSRDRNCTVRLHGDLIVSYYLRAVGGPKRPALLREEDARRFAQAFELDSNPDPFFQSYSVCRDAIHQMLTQTPLVGEFDLSADNWDYFVPHDLATVIVHGVRRDADEHGGVALRFDVDISLAIRVEVVYDEPKALLLACKEAAIAQRWFVVMPAECCVCMEGLSAKDGAAEAVTLPCSHSFHRRCIVPWFYKVATCPMCRHGVSKYLVALTNTPKGKFPGLRA